MTAPVVGSGSCPAWMQRVAKSSRFDLVIHKPLKHKCVPDACSADPETATDRNGAGLRLGGIIP
jgi:hypothetical protein